jgi:hypothetical protein
VHEAVLAQDTGQLVAARSKHSSDKSSETPSLGLSTEGAAKAAFSDLLDMLVPYVGMAVKSRGRASRGNSLIVHGVLRESALAGHPIPLDAWLSGEGVTLGSSHSSSATSESATAGVCKWRLYTRGLGEYMSRSGQGYASVFDWLLHACNCSAPTDSPLATALVAVALGVDTAKHLRRLPFGPSD